MDHVISFYLLLSKKKWVWPFDNSFDSTFVGLILGNKISFSGTIPISFKFLLIAYFSIPLLIPLYIMVAPVLKAALVKPAQNLPLSVSFAPIKFIIGYLSVSFNLFNISV